MSHFIYCYAECRYAECRGASRKVQNAMEQHIFAFSLIIEGTIEKVLQLIVALKSIYNQKPWFY
jgi:hypothetical protein